MLVEIENGAQERIQDKIQLATRKVNVGQANARGPHTLTLPEVTVGVAAGVGKKVSQTTTRVTVRLFIMVTFKNLRGEKQRRHGSYPILLAIIQYLQGHKLGLDILPLDFTRFDHTTSEEEAERGLIVYTLEFSTAFDLKAIEDDEEAAPLVLALEYFLKPGDDVKDMDGKVDLSTGG